MNFGQMVFKYSKYYCRMSLQFGEWLLLPTTFPGIISPDLISSLSKLPPGM